MNISDIDVIDFPVELDDFCEISPSLFDGDSNLTLMNMTDKSYTSELKNNEFISFAEDFSIGDTISYMNDSDLLLKDQDLNCDNLMMLPFQFHENNNNNHNLNSNYDTKPVSSDTYGKDNQERSTEYNSASLSYLHSSETAYKSENSYTMDDKSEFGSEINDQNRLYGRSQRRHSNPDAYVESNNLPNGENFEKVSGIQRSCSSPAPYSMNQLETFMLNNPNYHISESSRCNNLATSQSEAQYGSSTRTARSYSSPIVPAQSHFDHANEIPQYQNSHAGSRDRRSYSTPPQLELYQNYNALTFSTENLKTAADDAVEVSRVRGVRSLSNPLQLERFDPDGYRPGGSNITTRYEGNQFLHNENDRLYSSIDRDTVVRGRANRSYSNPPPCPHYHESNRGQYDVPQNIHQSRNYMNQSALNHMDSIPRNFSHITSTDIQTTSASSIMTSSVLPSVSTVSQSYTESPAYTHNVNSNSSSISTDAIQSQAPAINTSEGLEQSQHGNSYFNTSNVQPTTISAVCVGQSTSPTNHQQHTNRNIPTESAVSDSNTTKKISDRALLIEQIPTTSTTTTQSIPISSLALRTSCIEQIPCGNVANPAQPQPQINFNHLLATNLTNLNANLGLFPHINPTYNAALAALAPAFNSPINTSALNPSASSYNLSTSINPNLPTYATNYNPSVFMDNNAALLPNLNIPLLNNLALTTSSFDSTLNSTLTSTNLINNVTTGINPTLDSTLISQLSSNYNLNLMAALNSGAFNVNMTPNSNQNNLAVDINSALLNPFLNMSLNQTINASMNPNLHSNLLFNPALNIGSTIPMETLSTYSFLNSSNFPAIPLNTQMELQSVNTSPTIGMSGTNDAAINNANTSPVLTGIAYESSKTAHSTSDENGRPIYDEQYHSGETSDSDVSSISLPTNKIDIDEYTENASQYSLHNHGANRNHIVDNETDDTSTTDKLIGAYTRVQRKLMIQKFRSKKSESKSNHNLVKYDCRKLIADARPRVNGKFAVTTNAIKMDNITCHLKPKLKVMNPGRFTSSMPINTWQYESFKTADLSLANSHFQKNSSQVTDGLDENLSMDSNNYSKVHYYTNNEITILDQLTEKY